jgi:hypothetical protein
VSSPSVVNEQLTTAWSRGTATCAHPRMPVTGVYVHAYPALRWNLYADTDQPTSRRSHSASTRRLDRELTYGPDRNLPTLLGWLRMIAPGDRRGTDLPHVQ